MLIPRSRRRGRAPQRSSASPGARPIGSTGVHTAPRANTRTPLRWRSSPAVAGSVRSPGPAAIVAEADPAGVDGHGVAVAVDQQAGLVERRLAVRVRPPGRRRRGHRASPRPPCPHRPRAARASRARSARPREARPRPRSAAARREAAGAPGPPAGRRRRRAWAAAAARRRRARGGAPATPVARGRPAPDPGRIPAPGRASWCGRSAGSARHHPRPPARPRAAALAQQRVQRPAADRELGSRRAAGRRRRRRARRTSTGSRVRARR